MTGTVRRRTSLTVVTGVHLGSGILQHSQTRTEPVLSKDKGFQGNVCIY